MASWTEPATITAVMSAIAAGLAALATWRAPMSAARIAEELRKGGEKAADERRFKLNVFATLMQERSEIYSVDAVRALNSIDVAFSESPAVREAWAELFQALNQPDVAPSHVVDERIRRLLGAMASDLGIADKLRLDDFARVYIPTAIAQERRVRDWRRRNEFEQVMATTTTTNTQAEVEKKWPPAPKDGRP